MPETQVQLFVSTHTPAATSLETNPDHKRDELFDLAGNEVQVTLLCLVEGQPRRVEVRLGGDDYGKEVKAHGAQQTVNCQGELVRRGNLFRLENARQFSVEE